MFKNAWIMPDNFLATCDTYYYKNHRDIVQKYLLGLEEYDNTLYLKLKSILDKDYTFGDYVSYNDFAIFVLGWIELCNKDKNAIVYCGYDFQENVVSTYLRGNVRLDKVFTLKLQYVLVPHSSVKLLKIGLNRLQNK